MGVTSNPARTLMGRAVKLVPYRWRGYVRHIPLVAAGQRWLIQRIFSGREFVHTIDDGPARGLKFCIQLPQDKAIWLGNYESHFSRSLSAAVKRGDVCYDIGGFRGFMAGVLALAGARTVNVFEPMPANARAIRRLAELNPNLPLKIRELAVGARDGRARFLLLPEASMGKLDSSQFQPGCRGERQVEVETACLDGLVSRHEVEPPDLMKIDVEGAELDVLEGAKETIRLHRPRLFIEAHTRSLAQSCGDFLHTLKYDLSVLETGRPTGDPATPEVCHLVCVPI